LLIAYNVRGFKLRNFTLKMYTVKQKAYFRAQLSLTETSNTLRLLKSFHLLHICRKIASTKTRNKLK